MTQSRLLDRKTPPHIVTLVMIAGLSALNMNIFLPSLPDMAIYFSTDYTVMQLAISAYLAGTAVLQLVIGPLSDRLGRRPVLLASLCILLVATLVCIFAPTITIFLVGRLIQTTVISGLVLSRAIVRDMVPLEEAASMLGYVTMGMTIVPMIGPALGGLLNDLFGWQSTFVFFFALAVCVLALVWADLGETNRFRSPNFAAQFRAWPQLLGSGRFWGYSLTATFSSGVFFAFLGGAPYVASVMFKQSPSEFGLYFFFAAGGYMAGNFISGRYARRTGITAMMAYGNLINIFGAALTAGLFLAGIDTALAFFAPMLFIGIGNGVTLPSANAGIVSVQPHLAGSASGLGGALTIGGGAAFSTLAGFVLTGASSPMPLLAVMGLAGILALVTTLYIARLDHKAGMLVRAAP